MSADRTETAERIELMIALKRGALAARGRGWLRAEAARVKAALHRVGFLGRYEDGTRACLEGQLEDLRAAWVIA